MAKKRGGAQMDDFTTQAKEKYESIVGEEERLKGELEKLAQQKKPLYAYLIAAGVMEKRRGRPKMKE